MNSVLRLGSQLTAAIVLSGAVDQSQGFPMSNLVCVKTFPDRLQADMAKQLLEANGITASVSADDMGGMRPDLAFTSGGVKLFVLDENADKALALLNEDAIENE
jgi:hypothetical protein